MSAPKLGEYVGEASAGRRERILRDQKFPPTFQQIRYRDADVAIRGAVLAGGDVLAELERRASLIGARAAANAYQANVNRCAAQAVRTFAGLMKMVIPANATATTSNGSITALEIAGVRVSVQPTLYFQRKSRSGEVQMGALLAVYRKERRLTDRGGIAVAELVRRALVATRGADIKVAPDLCVAVDVFGRVHWSAPARSQRLGRDLESTCREIAARWPELDEGSLAA